MIKAYLLTDVDIANNDASQNLERAKPSDDNDQLIVLQITKELQDIFNKRRKSIYKEVYAHSSDDEQFCSSYNKENSKIAVGDKKETFTYACKTHVSDVEVDGE